MNEKAGSFELLEPKSPESLAPDPWLEPWMIVAAIFVLLVIAAFLLIRRNKPARFDPLVARQAAHEEAVRMLANIGDTNARDAAVQVSLILRKYLVNVSGDPALFETHEETIARHEALHAFTDEARAQAGEQFTRLAALKYAEEVPDVATGEVSHEARTLLETLHHGFRS